MRRFLTGALALFLAAPAFAAKGTTKYFVYHFGFDDGHLTPEKTHTWATFVSAHQEAGKATVFQPVTISWLPRSGNIKALTFGPERGRNYGLEETFAWAEREHLALGQWGPYETTKQLYDLAVSWKHRLDNEYWYRVLDNSNRIFKVLAPATVPTPPAVMCSHAVADVVYDYDPKGFLLTGRAAGFAATKMVVWHLTDWYVRTPGDPQYLNPVDETLKAQMDAALNLPKHPSLQRFALEAQNNHYCKTLEECRQSSSIINFSGN